MDLDSSDVRHILEEAVEEFRHSANQKLDQLLSKKRAAAEDNRVAKQQRTVEGREALDQVLQSAGTPTSSEVFLSSIVRIRTEGKLLNLHSSVVQKLPYFAAMLSGRWSETDIFDLKLPEPCSFEDFLVVIEHVYWPQQAPFLFDSLGSALRAALVASMLLVDEKTLADIGAAVSRNVKTKDDVNALRAFVKDFQLPSVFTNIVSGEEVIPMDVDTFKEMVSSVASTNNKQKQEFAAALIATQVSISTHHKQALYEAVTFDGCWCYTPISGWWLDLVMRHASGDQTTAVLFNISKRRQCVPRCGQHNVAQLSEVFFANIRGARSHGATHVGLSSEKNMFYFGQSATGLEALCVALRLPGSAQILKQMEECSPAALEGLLSREVLKIIPDEKRFIAKMCTDKRVLCGWANSEILKALPFEARAAVCSALLSQIAHLSTDVLEVVRATV